MKVSHQGKQVSIFVAEDRLVSSLKEMTCLVMSAIEILGIRRSQPLHHPRKHHVTCLQEQVDMIGHENITVEGQAEALSCFMQSPKILSAIHIVKKDPLPPISADQDMIEGPGELNSRLPRHCPLHLLREGDYHIESQIASLTPSLA
jgi:hypothetical protein